MSLGPHKLTGARFRRDDGTLWLTGDVHVPTRREWSMRRHKLRPTTEPETPPPAPHGPLAPRFAGVDFASDKAYELARDALPPLTAEELAALTGSGQAGALTKADVERYLEARRGQD